MSEEELKNKEIAINDIVEFHVEGATIFGSVEQIINDRVDVFVSFDGSFYSYKGKGGATYNLHLKDVRKVDNYNENFSKFKVGQKVQFIKPDNCFFGQKQENDKELYKIIWTVEKIKYDCIKNSYCYWLKTNHAYKYCITVEENLQEIYE